MDFSTLTPGQKQTVTTLSKPLFVAAGAGSGKTFTLTNRVVWALTPGSGEDGKPYLESLDQALVITFTRAAAEEIKERIRSALQKAGMESAALEVDNAWVSTIHGMCARILRAHALDLGIDPAFVMMSDVRAQEARELAIETALAEVQDIPEFKELFKSHNARGGMGGDSPMSVSGMVETLSSAIAAAPNGYDSLVWGETPQNLSSDFSSLAARYEELLATGTHKYPDEEEFLASSISEIEAAQAGTAPDSRDLAWAQTLMSKLVKPHGGCWRAKASKEACSAASREYDELSCLLLLSGEARLREPLLKLVRLVDDLYQAKKDELCALDNDDLLRMALFAFKSHPEIARAYSKKFKLVMVDEFQDTSEQQVKMISMLSGVDACHLTTVGDAQQSIYRFRGADVGVFRRRETQMDRENRPQMADNFRSHDDILRFVKAVCSAQGLIPDFMDLHAGRDEERVKNKERYQKLSLPRICVELTVNDVQGRKGAPATSVVQIAATQIADRLAQLKKEGVPLSDMALLLGRMKNTAVFVDAFRARGLECVVTGGSTFSATEEVGVVCDLLRTLANPHDSEALFSVLTSSMFSLDANDLALLATKRREQDDLLAKRPLEQGMYSLELIDGLEASSRLNHAFKTLQWAWFHVGKESVPNLLLGVLNRSGWLQRLETYGAPGRSVAANIIAAVSYVRDLSEDAHFGVARAAREFALWLKVAKAAPASLVGGELNAVSVMTVHSSKGLEYPVVAVAETLNDPAISPSSKGALTITEGDNVFVELAPRSAGILDVVGEDLPDNLESCTNLVERRAYLESRDKQEEIAEKARLLYVALTRAREYLIFSIPTRHSTPKKGPEKYTPTLAGICVDSLFGGSAPAAGESTLSYGGSVPALVRTIRTSYKEDAPVLPNTDVSTGGALDVALLNAGDKNATSSIFELFETGELEAAQVAPEKLQPLKQDVYSYTSAQREHVEISDKPRVQSAYIAPMMCDLNDTSFVGTTIAHEEVRAVHDDNPDDLEPRATNLGSAFHALAQYMVETGEVPTTEQIENMARSWGCTKAQLGRLKEALTRWCNSEVRKQALDYSCVRAEVPFFIERKSVLGNYLRGAIDLLSYNPESKRAFVVDYKTGDAKKSAEELEESHRDQAQVYASVLLEQGFSEVECAFVCVERDDGTGQPVVIQYSFSEE